MTRSGADAGSYEPGKRSSLFAKTGEKELRAGLGRLADDLRTGRWHDNHADLLRLGSLDVGYSLAIAEL